MILSEIEARARHILDEIDPDLSHWSPTRLRDFIHEGYVDVVTNLPAPLMPGLQDNLKHHLSIGVVEYDMPADYVKLWYIKAYGEKATILDISEEGIITHNYFYNPSTKNPAVIIQGGKCYVYPTPTELVDNGLQIYHIDPPARMTDPSDEPKLLSRHHDWIAQFAVYRCLNEDADPRADNEFNKYQAHFEQFKGK